MSEGERRIINAKFSIQNAKFRIQNQKYIIKNFKSRIKILRLSARVGIVLEVRGFTRHCFSTARLNDCSTVIKLNLLHFI